MIDTTLLKSAGVLIVAPTGPISDADISEWRAALAGHLEQNAEVKGLLVDAKAFPGYTEASAFFGHLGIIRDFHSKIDRLALVTDMVMASFAETFGKFMLGVEARRFPAGERDKALAWLTS
jgi:hypothetical protein